MGGSPEKLSAGVPSSQHSHPPIGTQDISAGLCPAPDSTLTQQEYPDALECALEHAVRRMSDSPDNSLAKILSFGNTTSDQPPVPQPTVSSTLKPSSSTPNFDSNNFQLDASHRTAGSDDTTDGRDTSTSSSSTKSGKRARAKMAARFMSKPIRKSYIGMIAGLGCTIGFGQALYLKATYESPPDARGPRCGIERSMLRESDAPKMKTTAPVEPGGPVLQMGAMRATAEGTQEVKVNSQVGAELVSGGGKHNPGRKRILIIGDSLVSGVGGLSSFEDGPSDGPALPRQVARFMSRFADVDVQWNAVSLTGGDVRLLNRKILPLLTREKEKGTLGDIWGLVVVTGVNDWKRISPVRTANRFREDLKSFIDEVRGQVGDECHVFLPAIPGVRYTPRFHEPLRSIVVWLNDYWDAQKLLLSRSMSRVYFIGQPPNHEWGDDPKIFFSTLDRVHPSELGYERWGERIAKVMSRVYFNATPACSETTALHGVGDDDVVDDLKTSSSKGGKLSGRRASAPDISTDAII